MKPYTYLIRHRPTNRVYYGVRCANTLDPEQDLWHTYFTSSPKVQQLIEETGQGSFDVEIRRVFDNKEQAVAWETRVLRKCNVLKDDRWINQNIAGYVVPTQESNRKISNYWKGRPKSQEQIEKIRQSNLGKKRSPRSEEYRKKLSKSKSGENNPRYGAEVSEETRRKIGEANRGRTPVNKGKPMSEEQKDKIRATLAKKRLNTQSI